MKISPSSSSVHAITKKDLEFYGLKFGTHIAYSMQIYTGTYNVPNLTNLALDTFAPAAFNIASWLDAYQAAKMKYAVLTVKSPDGFCIYPTAYHITGSLPYGLADNTWYKADPTNRDITKLFVDGCIARNIKPIAYFSIQDGTSEVRKGGSLTEAERIAMIEFQVNEILTAYPNLYGFWFDLNGSNWAGYWATFQFTTFYNYVKSIKPNILIHINDQLGVSTPGDICGFEGDLVQEEMIPFGNTLYAEDVVPMRINNHWYWVPSEDQTSAGFHTAAKIKYRLDRAQSRKGNLLLGTMPDTDGKLPQVQIDLLTAVGALIP